MSLIQDLIKNNNTESVARFSYREFGHTQLSRYAQKKGDIVNDPYREQVDYFIHLIYTIGQFQNRVVGKAKDTYARCTWPIEHKYDHRIINAQGETQNKFRPWHIPINQNSVRIALIKFNLWP